MARPLYPRFPALFGFVFRIVVATFSLPSLLGAQSSAVATPERTQQTPSIMEGAWRVVEVAARAPNEAWVARPGPQAGIYVFTTRYYSYAYIPGVQPRHRFVDPNRPSEAERAAAYDSFIGGAGSYSFDGTTLSMKTEIRKNPNEMTGDHWHWKADLRGDTLRLVFANPPFLPGREWRTTLVRIE